MRICCWILALSFIVSCSDDPETQSQDKETQQQKESKESKKTAQAKPDYMKILNPWKEEYQEYYKTQLENAKIQTFDEYWKYVQHFFITDKIPYRFRVIGAVGWFNFADKVIAKVEEKDRAKAREKIYLLGKQISKEWSKDNKVRKFFSRPSQGTPNLKELFKKFDPIVSKDSITLDEVDTIVKSSKEVLATIK